MKNITALLFATIITLNVSGQSFGLKGGAAITNFIGADVENSDANTGFYLGAFMKLGEGNIEWMPEILFHQKGAKSDGGNVLQVMNYIDIGVNGLFHINDELALAIGPYLGYAASGTLDGKSITDWDGANRVEFGSNLGAIYNLNDLLHLDLRYGIAFTDIFDEVSVRNSSIQIGIGYVFSY
jgi:hypothetical protein